MKRFSTICICLLTVAVATACEKEPRDLATLQEVRGRYVNLSDGKAYSGPGVEYYKSGKVSGKGFLEEGQRTEWESSYEDGQVASKGNLKNGLWERHEKQKCVVSSICTFFFTHTYGQFKNFKEDGEWIQIDEDEVWLGRTRGELFTRTSTVLVATYESGRAVSATRFAPLFGIGCTTMMEQIKAKAREGLSNAWEAWRQSLPSAQREIVEEALYPNLYENGDKNLHIPSVCVDSIAPRVRDRMQALIVADAAAAEGRPTASSTAPDTASQIVSDGYIYPRVEGLVCYPKDATKELFSLPRDSKDKARSSSIMANTADIFTLDPVWDESKQNLIFMGVLRINNVPQFGGRAKGWYREDWECSRGD